MVETILSKINKLTVLNIINFSVLHKSGPEELGNSFNIANNALVGLFHSSNPSKEFPVSFSNMLILGCNVGHFIFRCCEWPNWMSKSKTIYNINNKY